MKTASISICFLLLLSNARLLGQELDPLRLFSPQGTSTPIVLPPVDTEPIDVTEPYIDKAPTELPASIGVEVEGPEPIEPPRYVAPPVFDVTEVEQWFRWKSWDASFELGINGADGNSQTLSILSGFELKRKTDLHVSHAKIRYAMARTENIETQNNALLKLTYERLMYKSPWSMFVKNDILYNRFKPFDFRLVINGGMPYQHFENDISSLKTRFGAGTSREFGGPDNGWVPEAVFGVNYNRQLSKRQKFAVEFEYFPEWGSFNDFRCVSDISWQFELDDEAKMNLKLSILDTYDSTPNGAKPNDILYAILLLWKL